MKVGASEVSVKTMWKLGAGVIAFVSFLTAVVTSLSYARPVLNSDWGQPFAGIPHVETYIANEDTKYQTLAANYQQQQRRLDGVDQTQAFLSQGFWSNQLLLANAALRKNPNDTLAAGQKQNAEAQLFRLKVYFSKHQPGF